MRPEWIKKLDSVLKQINIEGDGEPIALQTRPTCHMSFLLQGWKRLPGLAALGNEPEFLDEIVNNKKDGMYVIYHRKIGEIFTYEKFGEYLKNSKFHYKDSYFDSELRVVKIISN